MRCYALVLRMCKGVEEVQFIFQATSDEKANDAAGDWALNQGFVWRNPHDKNYMISDVYVRRATTEELKLRVHNIS